MELRSGRIKRMKLENPLVQLAMPARLQVVLDMPPASWDELLKHSWNGEDSSPNIELKDNLLTLHRVCVVQSTDSIRGKVGLTKGLHVWEVHWSRGQRGTHAVVGVATEHAPLHCDGYQTLVGSNDQSWGWHLGHNKIYHDATDYTSKATYPELVEPNKRFLAPDRIIVALDMDEGSLSFVINDQYVGVAFRGLEGKKLFPIVSAVWGHCLITMKYIGCVHAGPLPLMALCRQVVRQKMGKRNIVKRISNLNIPHTLKVYLLYHDREYQSRHLRKTTLSLSGPSC